MGGNHFVTMDVVSPSKRSQVMASIRSRGNKSTELRFIRILKECGLVGWRRGYPLSGRPDFTFPKQRVAVFLDGCFWHGCERHCRMPASNRQYWAQKIDRNKRRDQSVTKMLRNKGWVVIRFWEHDLKGEVGMKKIRTLAQLLQRN